MKASDHSAVLTPVKVQGKEGELGEESQKVLASPLGWGAPEQDCQLEGSVKVKVTQLCLTLCDPVDCSLPGSSVHGILQARILE